MKLYEGYFTGQGRMGRLEYTKRLMVVWGATIAIWAAMMLVKEIHEAISYPFLIAMIVVSRGGFLCLYLRRLHDLNRSGWWILPIVIIGLDLFLLMPILTLWPGTKGPNNHGPPPTT